MSTLESQYKEFLKLNPKTDLPFEEWKKINARLVKQALINMMKEDEDLGLYDEPKQNWYHDGKIIDGKQETLYSEEDMKSAFLDGWQLRDGDLPFSKAKKKWFKEIKKKS